MRRFQTSQHLVQSICSSNLKWKNTTFLSTSACITNNRILLQIAIFFTLPNLLFTSPYSP